MSLLLIGKPKLRKLSPVIEAEANTTPKLVCEASGWPVPSLSWWRNGSKIHDGDYLHSYMIRKSDINQLWMKILAIEGYHHGTYSCRANNTLGASEEYVNIMVKRDEMIENDYRDQQGTVTIEGRNATLECICVKTECKEETASTYWKYNDLIVNASQKFKFSKQVLPNAVKMAMTILDVLRTDQGMYLCGINTSKGFAEIPRRLRVISKVNAPRISATSNASATPGSPTWLRCKAIYPVILTTPKTFWLFNNTRLAKESQHYQSKEDGPRMGPNSTTKRLSPQLHISNVSAQDVGWYTCGADFKIDVVTANVFFSLKEETPREEADDPNTDSSSEDSPLVAISSITAGGIIMGFVVAFVAYRLCRNRRNADEPFFETPVNGRQFRYDVFVTFSSQDLNWVNKELLPLLEKHKLIYCIHDRDFEIGKAVVDNMAESVYTSRKVLAVMSHNYMSSKFCRGELEMALYRSTEMGDSSVIVMRIDGVDRSKLPKALRNRTFLDHYDITERKTWEERLIKHLKPPQIDKSAEKKSMEKCYTLLNDTEV